MTDMEIADGLIDWNRLRKKRLLTKACMQALRSNQEYQRKELAKQRENRRRLRAYDIMAGVRFEDDPRATRPGAD